MMLRRLREDETNGLEKRIRNVEKRLSKGADIMSAGKTQEYWSAPLHKRLKGISEMQQRGKCILPPAYFQLLCSAPRIINHSKHNLRYCIRNGKAKSGKLSTGINRKFVYSLLHELGIRTIAGCAEEFASRLQNSARLVKAAAEGRASGEDEAVPVHEMQENRYYIMAGLKDHISYEDNSYKGAAGMLRLAADSLMALSGAYHRLWATSEILTGLGEERLDIFAEMKSNDSPGTRRRAESVSHALAGHCESCKGSAISSGGSLPKGLEPERVYYSLEMLNDDIPKASVYGLAEWGYEIFKRELLPEIYSFNDMLKGKLNRKVAEFYEEQLAYRRDLYGGLDLLPIGLEDVMLGWFAGYDSCFRFDSSGRSIEQVAPHAYEERWAGIVDCEVCISTGPVLDMAPAKPAPQSSSAPYPGL